MSNSNDAATRIDSEFLRTEPGVLNENQADDVASSTQSGHIVNSKFADGGSYFSDFQSHPFVRPMRSSNELSVKIGLPFQPHANRLFELLRQVSLQQNLKSFDQLDMKTRVLARLGGLLVMYREDFHNRLYHFMAEEQLIAVLDRAKGKLLIKNPLHAMDCSNIAMHEVQRSQPSADDDFERVSVQDAVWLYARHDPEAALDLPSDVGRAWLQLRKLPKVSPRLIYDTDLAMMRALSARPQRFDDVREKTKLPTQLLQLRALTCLYLTRCLSVSESPLHLTDA